jgi:hypothetical protein
MKKIVTTLGLMVLTGTLFFACAPAFEPPGAEKYNLRSAYAKDRYTTITLAAPTLALQPTDGKGASIQAFTITTSTYENGSTTPIPAPTGSNPEKRLNLDIEGGQIPGLSIKIVTSVPAFQRYTLGDAIPYTALKTGANTVEISLALTESWINTNGFVVYIDSTVATFNGEKILNQDEDNLVAEGEEDDFAVTGTFTGSSTRTTFTDLSSEPSFSDSLPWASRSTELVKVNTGSIPIPSIIKSGEAYSPVNIKDTGSENDNLIDTEALKTAFQAQKLSAEGTWGPFTVTSTYHSKDETIDGTAWNTGDVEVRFDDLSDYDQIRYRIDNYYIKESTAVGGFIHRRSYNNGIKDRPNDTIPADDSSWNYVVVGTISKEGITGDIDLPGVTVDDFTYGGVTGAYTVDVDLGFTSGIYNSEHWDDEAPYFVTSFDPDTPELPAVNGDNYSKNLKIFHRKGNKVQDLLDLSGFRFEKRGPLTFRIYLPKNFRPFDGTTNGLDIYVLPGLAPTVPVKGSTQTLRPTGNNAYGGAICTTSKNYTW